MKKIENRKLYEVIGYFAENNFYFHYILKQKLFCCFIVLI